MRTDTVKYAYSKQSEEEGIFIIINNSVLRKLKALGANIRL